MSLIERAINQLGTVPSDALAPQGTSGGASAQPADSAAGLAVTLNPLPRTDPAPVVALRAVPAPEAVFLDTARLMARGFVDPNGEQSEKSQEFRIIKRPLIQNAFGQGAAPVKNGKRVMVTSAMPHEGKTYCAINLAMSIATERDLKVILVDADIARPTLMAELGVPEQPGLMEVIGDGLPPAAVVIPTNVRNLSLITAGRREQLATEFLASVAMQKFLDQLSTDFPDTIVVFDSPPLLVTTEARVLAHHMGQIVLVVQAGKTGRADLAEAIETLEGCEIIGLLLNKASKAGEGSGYTGYGYGYGKN